jgi:beta-galactosidase
MSRSIVPLNRDWNYAPFWRDEFAARALGPADGVLLVDLPHANVELPFNDFDEGAYQFVSCYQKRLAVPEAPEGQGGKGRVFLDFEGIASCAEVFVEGEPALSHEGGYTPFAVDLSRWQGREVLLAVKVDSTERPEVPPFGKVIDYLTYGGIYREAFLRAVPPAFIANVFPRPKWEASSRRASLSATVYVAGDLFEGSVRLTLSRGGKEFGRAEGAFSLPSGVGEARSAFGDAPSLGFELDFGSLDGVLPWGLDEPELYDLKAELFPKAGGAGGAGGGANEEAAIDAVERRIGFREAMARPDGFYLNGERLVLRGLDRHQAFPYAGYAMPERVQRRDAEILKRELAVNCVRSSHYPPSRHFLDACDELGLLVLEEIPGWQHIGGVRWKARSLENLREMIVRDWAHPCVFTWGVRINESQDDHDFYAATNALARSLDPTRQTSGVRYLERSELLEDIYTMNDFIMGSGETALRLQGQVTGLSHNVPYLVTENNGHMYPAKRYDAEERLVEHAMRHARIHDAAAANGDSGGALSWVFADYNTHYQFGAGDRICYHGVMDMFRVPKFAAHFYASQRPLAQGPVLEPLTIWARGERAECRVMPIAVMTNCDEAGFSVGAIDKGRFAPDRLKWAGLPHPPILVETDEGAWGSDIEDAVFTGYVGGKAVIERRFAKNPVPVALELKADSSELRAQGPGEAWDAMRVVLRLVDRCGNHLSFAFDPVKLSVEGPGRIVGPSEFSLLGGMSALWLRATGAGTIRLRAHTPRLESKVLEIVAE